MRARKMFREAQKEYLGRIRDHLEMYAELESCLQEPAIARSWMAHLDMPTLIWEAKERLSRERNRIMEWVTSLKDDKNKELDEKELSFSTEEVRTFVLENI